MKNLAGNLLLLFFSFAVVFVIGEVASRFIAPISPGPAILDLQGNRLTASYISPGQSFRITTPDFDAVTSITADGYRAPEAKENPEIIFIGDSFTYAQGVEDQQTFPAIYCKAKRMDCANLAVPGASTLYEIDRLERFLRKKRWSPNFVDLFFFTGNDFSDNLQAAERRSQGKDIAPLEVSPAAQAKKGLFQRIIETGLYYSNLLRVAYYKVLPMLRDNPQQSEDALNKALKITRSEFLRLDELSNIYAFSYRIFIVFPQHEIEQGVDKKIAERIQSISPAPVIPLGDLFRDDPGKYYFPTDGHFSVAGNKKLAEFLLQNYY